MRYRFFIILLSLLLALITACRGRFEVEPSPGGGAALTLTLSEDDINDAISQALERSGNPLLRDPHVDLQEGVIVITGEHERREGGGRVGGTIRMTLSVEDGALIAQVTDVEIEGIEASDEQIEQLNERIAQALTSRAGRDRRILRMSSVTITEDAIEFVLTVERGE